MPLKPWRNVIEPREDLRESKPFEASEFAVHLDQVREDRAPDVYQNPQQFFERTFLTQNLLALSGEVVRRLSGEMSEAAPVFNLATQFGGGKTHALTLLYHLATAGPEAAKWMGVHRILDRAGISSVPKAATAVFVGQQFDSLAGRGGDDGTPHRRSPWGEIAFQLGGEEGFAAVAEHDREMVAPGGDVIRQFLPEGKPALILLDELMNYMSRFRAQGWGGQLYNFIQNLSEESRSRGGIILAASIPGSELEMTADDQSDYQRLHKMLNRLGKPIVMSAEEETSEIIRRRLFDWDPDRLSQSGKVMLPKEAEQTCREYADWVQEHRRQLPEWFSMDHAEETFRATYPFHPSVISVFERKWQVLPQFQRTRGVLQLLALWVARAYSEGSASGHKDSLIGLGTAPLDDVNFRTAVFGQLGEDRLEGVVTTDICGRPESHAVRRDNEAVDAIRKARLHRKVATTIFFESNGGQQHAEATVPEIRLAVGEPGLDIGNVEAVLETLTDACYFLSIDKSRYRFSVNANLNKVLADKRAGIPQQRVEDLVRKEVQSVFAKGPKVERIFFPADSSGIPSRPALTFVVLPPEQTRIDAATLPMIERMTRDCGTSGRTFKSALIWCVPEGSDAIYEEARRLLALQDIKEEYTPETLGEAQWDQLKGGIGRSERGLQESIFRTYRHLFLLGKDNEMRHIDLGMITASGSESLVAVIIHQLQIADEVLQNVAPGFLARNWPPAMPEWSTRQVRDAFYASPRFPRLLNSEAVRDTIARGVTEGVLAYVTKDSEGAYADFKFKEAMSPISVEIIDEAYIITQEAAAAYKATKEQPAPVPEPNGQDTPTTPPGGNVSNPPVPYSVGGTLIGEQTTVNVASHAKILWSGVVPSQKWMSFYTKVLTRFATGAGLTLRVSVEIAPAEGVPQYKVDETRAALRELGLDDEVDVG